MDVPGELTEKLEVDWQEVTFLTEPISGKMGEFLIRSNGVLYHRGMEKEKVGQSHAGEPGVVWGGTGYCRLVSTDWALFDFTGNIEMKTSILGKEFDADVEIKFELKGGAVVQHEFVNINLIDNSSRKSHDKKIKQLAITRAQKMNTKSYRAYDSLIRKPIIFVARGIGYMASYIQDLTWKIERKLNK